MFVVGNTFDFIGRSDCQSSELKSGDEECFIPAKILDRRHEQTFRAIKTRPGSFQKWTIHHRSPHSKYSCNVICIGRMFFARSPLNRASDKMLWTASRAARSRFEPSPNLTMNALWAGFICSTFAVALTLIISLY